MQTEGEPSFQGHWRGTYRYNSRALDEEFGAVPFTMTIEEGPDGSFQGSVEDDAHEGGTPGTGSIKGRRKAAKLAWTKQMPIRCELESGLEKTIDVNREHAPLLYRGHLDQDGRRAQGTWRFGGLIGLINLRGTWTAERGS